MHQAEHPDHSANASFAALFPLPNVVLFPRAVLPLHIFEERYKAMTADVLRGDRQIAMALLRDGWEKNYHALPQFGPEIFPIVCVGTIVSHEKLADGKYNFFLEGHTRARVVKELPREDRLYRVAQLQPLITTHTLETDLAPQRQKMIDLFQTGSLARVGLVGQFRQMLTGPVPLATQDVADLIAFYLLDDLAVKQQLLEDADVLHRVDRTIDAVKEIAARLPKSPAHVPSISADYDLKHPDMN